MAPYNSIVMIKVHTEMYKIRCNKLVLTKSQLVPIRLLKLKICKQKNSKTQA